jgi:hypothetical protein
MKCGNDGAKCPEAAQAGAGRLATVRENAHFGVTRLTAGWYGDCYIHPMLRSITVVLLLAFAAGCASAPVATKMVASSSGRSTSEELECMSECLDTEGEDCESCVRQCLTPVAETVATLAAFK